MMVFHPVHVVPAEMLGRICSNLQIILTFLGFLNNPGYFYKNWTCN